MIEHVYRRASEARSVDAVLVATDDDRIAAAVDAFGGVAVMTRTDHPSGTDRLAEVARELASEVIVNVQGDEPMLDPSAIDTVVALVADGSSARMATLRKRIDTENEFQDPALVKVVVDAVGHALYFSRAPIPFTRAGHDTPVRWGHLGLYAYRRDFLLTIAGLAPTALERSEGLEQLRVLEHGYPISTAETALESIGVDTPEDLERVRRLMDAHVGA